MTSRSILGLGKGSAEGSRTISKRPDHSFLVKERFVLEASIYFSSTMA